MHKRTCIFSQIIDLVYNKKSQTIVNLHHGDYKVRNFTCWKQNLCMAFGQLTHREGLIYCMNSTLVITFSFTSAFTR
jgi:hypothetical protein